ncbi:MAG: SRPBCC family protein [Actinomycetota bacterium]
MATDVVVEDAPDRVERRSIVIDAAPDAIFDLLADPSRHPEFDGSGTVVRARNTAPTRLSEGAKFGMSMKRFLPYAMTNHVVEFVENETIAWRHLGRHVWRYTLEPTDDSTDDSPRTKVTEEFDWRPALVPFALKLVNYPADNAAAIEKTLVRLAGVVES